MLGYELAIDAAVVESEAFGAMHVAQRGLPPLCYALLTQDEDITLLFNLPIRFALLSEVISSAKLTLYS